ncbi:hypothetical protein ACWGLF_05610 [Streptomyces puniciscabiei]
MAAAPGNGEDAGSARTLLESQLAAPFRGRHSAHDRDRLDSFAAQRARNPDSEGLPATVAALRRHQADTLLVNHPFEEWPSVWLGTAPDQTSLSAAELQAFGATRYEQLPADAAFLYAAVATGAEPIVVPRAPAGWPCRWYLPGALNGSGNRRTRRAA